MISYTSCNTGGSLKQCNEYLCTFYNYYKVTTDNEKKFGIGNAKKGVILKGCSLLKKIGLSWNSKKREKRTMGDLCT